MQNNLLNHLLKWTFTLKWAKGDAGWWVKTGICSHLLMLTRVLTGFSERTRSTCCRKKWDWTVAARLRLDLCEGLLRQVKKKKRWGGLQMDVGKKGERVQRVNQWVWALPHHHWAAGSTLYTLSRQVLSLPSSPSMPPSSTPPLPKSILPHLSTAYPHAASVGQLNEHVKSFQLPSKALLFLHSCIFFAY